MGATSFWVFGTGTCAIDAFYRLKDEALYEHGHGGYTGTIAEKEGIIEFDMPEKYKDRPQLFAQEIHDNCHDGALWKSRYEYVVDKWGPACCVQLDETTWLFFGTASC